MPNLHHTDHTYLIRQLTEQRDTLLAALVLAHSKMCYGCHATTTEACKNPDCQSIMAAITKGTDEEMDALGRRLEEKREANGG